VQEGRLRRLAGCNCEEAWFDLMTVFIGSVAITGWSFPECFWMRPEIPLPTAPQEFFFAVWNGCGALLGERDAADLSTLIHSVMHMVIHSTTQDIVRKSVVGTKYSGDSGQVKPFYLLSKS
jgi:hypothetical protein